GGQLLPEPLLHRRIGSDSPFSNYHGVILVRSPDLIREVVGFVTDPQPRKFSTEGVRVTAGVVRITHKVNLLAVAAGVFQRLLEPLGGGLPALQAKFRSHDAQEPDRVISSRASALWQHRSWTAEQGRSTLSRNQQRVAVLDGPNVRLPSVRPEAAVLIERTDRRSEEHTSELQSRENLVCRLLLEK